MAVAFEAFIAASPSLPTSSGLGSSDMVLEAPFSSRGQAETSASKSVSTQPHLLQSKSSRRRNLVMHKGSGTPALNGSMEEASTSSMSSKVPQAEQISSVAEASEVSAAPASPTNRPAPSCLAKAASMPVDTPSSRRARRVRFAEGPLREALGRAGVEVTDDGHPNHEGQTAERRRELHAVFSEEAVTKHSIQLMEAVLGEENAASMQRLKRRFGLCPPAPRHLPYVTHRRSTRAPAKPLGTMGGNAKVPIMAKVPRVSPNGHNSPNRSVGLRVARYMEARTPKGLSSSDTAVKASQQGKPQAGASKQLSASCLNQPVGRRPPRVLSAKLDSSLTGVQEVQSGRCNISLDIPMKPAIAGQPGTQLPSSSAAGASKPHRSTRSRSAKSSASLQGGEEAQSGDRTNSQASQSASGIGGRLTRSLTLKASTSVQGGEEVQSGKKSGEAHVKPGLAVEMQGILEGLLGPLGGLEDDSGGEWIKDTSKRKAEVDAGDLRETASC